MKSKLKVATLPSGNGKWMLVSSLLLVLLVAATQAADEVSAGNGNGEGGMQWEMEIKGVKIREDRSETKNIIK